MPRHRLLVIATIFTLATGPLVSTAIRAAPPNASPPPEQVDGCDGLDAYFRRLDAVTATNEGLRTLATVNNDVLALTDAQASVVVASLDRLLVQLQQITPPAAARSYHTAYVGLITWYRDLALHRDAASHQRLINADKRIIPAVGRGIATGQALCGADVWTTAQQAAATPAA